jgi:GDPmannose 4,6-dehydratase
MDRRALILGIGGQDGGYLTELLASKGYGIVGGARDVAAARSALPASLRDRVELVRLDLRDPGDLPSLFARQAPSEIYNLAGFSSGEGMYEDPAGIGLVNGIAVTLLLEAMRQAAPAARFCQASSSEMFGEPSESPQTEASAFRPRSPYGVAKLHAHQMIGIYRRRYGLFACSAILFNHESPRRGPAFVTRKVAQGAARIKLGFENELLLGNLEARRDWGYAGDTVRAMQLMLQAPAADDYVVATGETHSVRELCERAFGRVGLDYREYVREDAAAFRPAEPILLAGSTAKARRILDWTPLVGFGDLVEMMVDAEMRSLSPAGR